MYPTKKLGEISKTTSGGTPLRSNASFWGGNIPWLKSGELNDNLKISSSEEFITEIGLNNSSAKLFKKGTLLIALYGATAGKLGILDFESTTNQAVCSIQNVYNVFIEKFLFYYLFSKREQIIKDSFGGAQPNISKSYLDNFPIPLPPLSTQKLIVQKLDQAFENIDKNINLTKENLKNLEELNKSVLEKVFSDGEYEMKKLGEICEFGPKKSETNILEKETLVSFVPMKYVNEKQMFFQSEEEKALNEVYKGYTYFAENDVLLAKVTPCFENGKSGIAKNLKNGIGFGSSEFYVFRINGNTIPEWIYYLFINDNFLKEGANNMSGAVGLKRVTKDFILNYKLPLPPLQKQKEIVEYLDEVFEKNKELKTKYEEQLRELEELKQSLLKDAFDGKLVKE
ncbi:MAG: restriction endonuclease subunit S [Candidatus Gracilibacteria bacterium]|nr:restriction endonuclease subunit S [Candidatus Gracilibacteria bacterium]